MRLVRYLRTRAKAPSYKQCCKEGEAYYKEIGSWPTLSTGEDARKKVCERCKRNTWSFAPMVKTDGKT